MSEDFNPRAVIGNNNPPEAPTPFDLLKQEIEDLFDTAKDFCDGEPIDTEAMADVVTELHDRIHECGKKAEDLRVTEKKPLDDQIAAIQTKFHPLIGNTKAGKGKVILAKDACQTLLTPWRQKVAAEKAAEAKRIADAAAAAKAAADAAMQESSGNLAAREEAEAKLADAKRLEKTAARTWKAATVGTGLRTTWIAAPDTKENSEELRLDWAFAKDASRFVLLVQQMADEAVRSGARIIPGFLVTEEKRAS